MQILSWLAENRDIYPMKDTPSLKEFFDQKVIQYSRKFFIASDPICIPHMFTKKQDIEIAAFFAAIFAWGNRTTIINKSRELMQMMDMHPHDFCLHASPAELNTLRGFRHRTFTDDDLYYFIHFLRPITVITNHWNPHLQNIWMSKTAILNVD